jgi:hypothetical protein
MAIYVRLLHEPVDVWRPVEADLVQDRVYRISAQSYDREIEKWEFEPGQEVECAYLNGADGKFFAAVRLAGRCGS